MSNGLHTIGFEVAEQEAEDLPDYYFYNDYYQKASKFSKEQKELFFIGRTGSGKSAILEMIRRKKGDSSRVISITEEDFAVQILLSSQEVSAIPTQYRNLAFKTLWKYVIIVNILKTLYGDDYKWTNFIHGDSKEAHELLNRFGELAKEQRTFTDQVISFLQRIQEVSIANIGGIKTGSGDTKSDLYNLFKVLNDFERHQLKDHVSKKYLYVLIDDLDKNWSGSKENVDLIRALFDCIVEIGTKFYGDIKFVVALRTDIFRQLDFHQTEKIRPYVVEIRWYKWQLQKIIESRLTSYWQGTLKESLSRFPSKIKEVDVFDFFIRRTMRRPRDIINFINLCINEANMRSASNISERDISAAEKQYSRFRIEALVDEWKYIYPDLEKWIDLFAGNKFVINYADLRVILEHENKPIKEIIDILYEVGFLGYRSPEDDEVKFSFISKGAPGFDHKYHVHVAFFSYLNERAEELGRTKCSQEESFPPQI
jgi:energy-coupling factor transporter ATP-binding protein EcfA2